MTRAKLLDLCRMLMVMIALTPTAGCGTSQAFIGQKQPEAARANPMKGIVLQWVPYLLTLEHTGKSKTTVLEHTARYFVTTYNSCPPAVVYSHFVKQWTRGRIKYLQYTFRARTRGPYQCMRTATIYTSSGQMQAPVFITVKRK